ncbi:MAG TPA: hypothetical protein PLN54_09900 [Flavobacteriales bacterium]|nr:hypothetical protein [Flavobacteriales bacterium]
MRWMSLTMALLVALTTAAQPDTVNVPNSTLGWQLSPHGTIRVLLIFAEIDWDVNPGKDPQSAGAEHWPKGQLPKWKDDIFDPHPAARYKGQVTQYYHDMSLGRFMVLGDYIDGIVTIRESEQPTVANAHGIAALAVKEANKRGSLRTRDGLSVADFDRWQRGGKPGMPKRSGPDDPHSYDHVMVIVRNSGLTHNQGSVDAGSPGKLFGFESDSQSRFGGMNALPYEILQHEFNHLLFGGNNFHVGGGNAAQFMGHTLCVQGGWSMMGGSSSSLLTGNAWDRDRLGWHPPGITHRIRARSLQGQEVNADLDPYNGDTGVYVLRDFMTTGDALRFRLPHLPEDEYPQWIWLENHQTRARNGIASDRFHWEDVTDCVSKATPGIYAYHQIARDDRYGSDVFGGHADYLKPLLAGGAFDHRLRGDTVVFECLFPNRTPPYYTDRRSANPLTGNHDQELPMHDRNGDGRLGKAEHYVPRIEIRDGVWTDRASFFGDARHAFTPQGSARIGMTTNPSTANTLTLLSNNSRVQHKGGKPDNRVVHLNGIAIELLEQRMNGDIVVRVRNDDHLLNGFVRWCADSIVLHRPPYHGRKALEITGGSTLLLDRSGTPTRVSDPVQENGRTWYSSPTAFTVSGGAHLHCHAGGRLELANGSRLHVMPGGVLELDTKAKVAVAKGCRIVEHPGATITGPAKALRKLRKSGRLVTVGQ